MHHKSCAELSYEHFRCWLRIQFVGPSVQRSRSSSTGLRACVKKCLDSTRKAAGWSLYHEQPWSVWVRARVWVWVCVQHLQPAQDNNRSKWLRNQCIVLSLGCVSFVYFIEQRNAAEEIEDENEDESLPCRSALAAYQHRKRREEAAARRNNLFTAIMRCEFMPLPGGTTTNSHLKCDKNSANGLESVSVSQGETAQSSRRRCCCCRCCCCTQCTPRCT